MRSFDARRLPPWSRDRGKWGYFGRGSGSGGEHHEYTLAQRARRERTSSGRGAAERASTRHRRGDRHRRLDPPGSRARRIANLSRSSPPTTTGSGRSSVGSEVRRSTRWAMVPRYSRWTHERSSVREPSQRVSVSSASWIRFGCHTGEVLEGPVSMGRAIALTGSGGLFRALVVPPYQRMRSPAPIAPAPTPSRPGH